MEPILKVEDLRMHYHTSKGAVKAIDGITFNLMPGETLGLVGESGCGKTSMGCSILRMPSPPGRYEGGKVVMGGRDILPSRRRRSARTSAGRRSPWSSRAR